MELSSLCSWTLEDNNNNNNNNFINQFLKMHYNMSKKCVKSSVLLQNIIMIMIIF